MGNELTKFACTACQREYLPASEFAEAQLERCAEQEHQNNAESTIKLLRALCKSCVGDVKADEVAKATERAEAAAVIAGEVTWEPVAVQLASRPFGVTPAGASDEGTVGYRVAKASEGKPARTAGVEPGWVLVSVSGRDVRNMPLKDIQPLVKEAALPAELGFERPPPEWHFCVECCRSQPPQAYSRKMLTKPVDKRRCSQCASQG